MTEPRTRELGAGGKEPQTRSQEPGARNQKQGIRSQEPGHGFHRELPAWEDLGGAH